MDLFDSFVVTTLLGGVLIGVAFGALTRLTGRVTSGAAMIGSLLGGAEGVAATSIAFVGGLVAAPLILVGFGVAPHSVAEPGTPLLVIGGVLVGISARWGGASLGGVITGISRRAPRALGLLVTLLCGATLGGILQVIFGGGSGA